MTTRYHCVNCGNVIREDETVNGLCPHCGCDEHVELTEAEYAALDDE